MIKRNINRIVVFLLIQFFCINLLEAKFVSPFNKLEIKDSSINYSFLVSGHFHGSSFNTSTFPAGTLLANIDTINSLNALFLMSLGDMFLDVNETIINHYQNSLFKKLKTPLLNAVGNHDLSNGNIYEKFYGKTFFSFINHSELFVVLNTEVNDGSILNEQLDFLKNTFSTISTTKIKSVFIFSHRPVWAESIEKYNNIFRDNTRSTFGNNNFLKEIVPIIKNYSSTLKIYWISGSLGGWAPSSFFYDYNEEYKITFIQTAIRDIPRDALLQVILKDGNISLKGISLTSQELNPIEYYSMNFWNNSNPQDEKFNFRMLPFFIKQAFFHPLFWTGFITGTIILIVILFIFNKWRKRK